MSKKYFWLKLKNDFFNGREIKKLRKIAGGDTFTIIYLKMQLLTINSDGLLQYQGTESSIIEQLSLELDETEDNIEMTLAFLQANNLVEQITQDQYLLNKVPEAIGSETGSAERMRKMRDRAKKDQEVLDNRNNVTPLLQTVTQSREDLDLDLEKELELDNNNDIVESKDGTKDKGSKAYDNDFEQLWKLYPKKQGKPDALRHYKKAIKDGVTNEEIEQGIKDYVEQIEINKTERQFIKLGSTWFSKKGWEDEYDTKDGGYNKANKGYESVLEAKD